MTHPRSPIRPGAAEERPATASDAEIADDLHALRGVTAQRHPTLETMVRAARSRADRPTMEGFAMFLRMLRQRPALAAALTAFVVAIGLSVIPISYTRTVGTDVALTLGGAMPGNQVADVARGLKSVLGAGGVTVEAQLEDGRTSYVLRASAPGDATGAAGAFAHGLEALGYDAAVETTPRRETVSTSVAAYAYGRVIEVRVDGKSAAELENEIRQRLAEAGITARVSVTDDADHRQVKVEADRTIGPGESESEVPELVLTKNGQPLTGGTGVRVMKTKDGSGATDMTVEVTIDERTVEARIPGVDSMSDAQIAAAIQSQLFAAGIDAEVTVNGDQITVTKRK